ncbi:MAG: hypothetical protein ACFFEA_05915 [Candidatus Thorarchaeota archaeon]
MQFEIIVNSMGILAMIPAFLLMLLMLYGVFTDTGRNRTLALLGFVAFLCAAVGFLTVSLTRVNILTGLDWANWGRYLNFGLRGIWLFLLVMYMMVLAFPDFLSARKWLVIVAIIGPIIYEILMFSTFSISSTTYGQAWLLTGLVLSILYMALIPLYATLRYTQLDRFRGSSQVKWVWLVLIGLLFWFIGELVLGLSQLLELPGWNSFFSGIGLMIVSAITIGWWLILLGYVFFGRTSQSGTS